VTGDAARTGNGRPSATAGAAPSADLVARLCRLVCVHVRDHRGPEADGILRERERYPWGGYAFFGGDLGAVRSLIARLRESSASPLLFASDLERGLGQQLAGGTSFPPPMALGAARSAALARAIGRATAIEARAVGLNCVFAPVLDLVNEPDNPIVCTRAFGESPELVAERGTALLAGLQEGGVLATAKHFPGHGRTRADSHSVLPVVEASAGELASDLAPFRAAVRAQVALVMSAHVAFPALEPDAARDRPATFSAAILTDLLRGKMGFRGAVVSDALMMGALEGVSAGERAARALAAGVDCLLYPPDPPETVTALARLVDEGTLPGASLERALVNLESALRRVEAAPDPLRSGENPKRAGAGAVPAPGANSLALEAARAGLVRVGDGVTSSEGRSLVLLLLDGGIARERVILPEVASAPGREFVWIVPEEGAVRIPSDIDAYGSVVLAYFSPVRAWKGRAGFSPDAARLAAALVRRRPDATLISFGSPFIMRDVPDLRSALLAFGDVPACQVAVGEVLTGERTPDGRLPVRL
jgi:beta-glucosidase-like glycosyl hydrolase